MGSLGSAGIVILAAVLILLIFAILKIPVKIIFKLLINTVLGFAVLLIINLLGGFIGVTVAANWINAIIIGVLGLPGVALILLLQWLAVV